MLELHAIAAKKAAGGGSFAVAMTWEERTRFLAGIYRNHGAYHTMLGTVNLERSTCSRPDDRDSIHAGICDSVGFAVLGRMVFGVMEEWMLDELREQIFSNIDAGNEESAILWIITLSCLQVEQGRYVEAVVLQEKVLEFRQRVLPEDHPGTGEVDSLI